MSILDFQLFVFLSSFGVPSVEVINVLKGLQRSDVQQFLSKVVEHFEAANCFHIGDQCFETSDSSWAPRNNSFWNVNEQDPPQVVSLPEIAPLRRSPRKHAKRTYPPPPEELQDLESMSNSPSRPPGNQSGVISPPPSKQLSAERSVMASKKQSVPVLESTNNELEISSPDRSEGKSGMEPLLKSHPGVFIKSETLRHAIRLAKKSGKPGYTLCYNLLPGVFSIEEIANSRGQGLTKPKMGDFRSPLDKDKVAAIKVTVSLLTLRGPYNHTAVLQQNATLSCKLMKDGIVVVNLHEVLEPYRLTWNFTAVGETEPRTVHEVYSNGLALPAAFVKYNNSHYTSDFDTSLHITNISFSDAGTYSCSLETDIKSFELYVIERPHCHNYNSSVQVNQYAFFDCGVSFHGNSPPEISWKHGSSDLNFTLSFENETYALARMSLIASEEDDGNVYICHVNFPTVHNGYICQTLPKLKVYFPVKATDILLNPHQTVYEEGSSITLRCVAIGEPHPHYLWTFNPLSDPHQVSNRSTNPVIKIINAQRSDVGNYTCTVHNEINHTVYTNTKIVFINVIEKDISTVRPKYRMMAETTTESNPSGDINNHTEEVMNKEVSAYAVGAVVSALLAILLIVVFILLAIKFKARERRYRERMALVQDEFTDDQEQELLDEDINIPNGISEEIPGQYRRLGEYWEIPKRDVRLMDLIATGSYCEVWRGRMRKHSDSTDVLRVAVKKILDDASAVGRKFFLAEMEVLKTLKAHSNVITLIGCYTLTEPWMLMLEYAQEGTLQRYLQKHRPGSSQVEIQSQESVRLKSSKIDAKKMLSLATQVIQGLLHLTKYKLICYRLSVSSVLVAKGGVCKLSGFGFQKEITDRNIYEKESLPIRCMAPESLSENIYDTRTDTFAFGILLWQIAHFGLKPYPSMDIEEVKEKVVSGYRMPRPQHCSQELFDLIERCWSQDPDQRSLYPDILQALNVLLIDCDSHVRLDDLPALSFSGSEVDSEHAL